jgi:hypothetical protein
VVAGVEAADENPHRLLLQLRTLQGPHRPGIAFIKLRFGRKVLKDIFKRLPGLWSESRDILILFIFQFHHFTAEPQRLPNFQTTFNLSKKI